MTTDTKAVLRWNSWGGERDIQESDDGQFVLFKDHERVVGGHKNQLNKFIAEAERTFEVYETDLAASRAEVEGLSKLLAETAQCLADVSNDVGGWAVEEVIESAMNAAMENGNV